MARTPSTMLELGTVAPPFTLFNPSTEKSFSSESLAGKPMLVAFICNHCPYVLHIAARFSEIAAQYRHQGINFVAINSNDVENYPDDSPEKMLEMAENYQFTFPYLYDESQQVAQAYRAACTPDIFLFDAEHRLYYRGQFDAARPKSDVPVTGKDLVAAMDRLIADETAPEEQLASLGCNIKWKIGNEPDYF